MILYTAHLPNIRNLPGKKNRNPLLKDKWQQKILLPHLKEHSKLSIKAFHRFFISCLILEIFSLKAINCSPSWIIEDMHVTSQVESRNVFILTASDQYEREARFWLPSQISN